MTKWRVDQGRERSVLGKILLAYGSGCILGKGHTMRIDENRRACCIRIRWPESQICKLIELYRDNPCLWNKDSNSYLDFGARRLAYRNIFTQIKECVPSVNLIEVIAKLREVRKYYANELRKIAETKYDSCAYESKYAWFDEIHSFLYPHLHLDEREDTEADSTYSSNYCSDETPSSHDGLSETCLSSETSKNSKMHLQIPSTTTTRSSSQQQIKTNSRLTEHKSCDQFDLFAKGVACRLRRMKAEAAAEAQIEIQRILTDLATADAATESNISDSDTYAMDCNCEVIMPHSQDKGIVCQESYTNYTV